MSETAGIETTRLVMIMNYVEKYQEPPSKGVSQSQLVHAGYTKEEIEAAESQGYIERLQGATRVEYIVPGYQHGSL